MDYFACDGFVDWVVGACDVLFALYLSPPIHFELVSLDAMCLAGHGLGKGL
jgi:hypothetical protein